MTHKTFPKPPKGEALLARKTSEAEHKAREQAIMRDAVRRDGHRCRVPDCTYRTMPIDPCHEQHRGMGGNPAEDRTTVETVIAACRIHHGLYDRGELDITPLTANGFRGRCEFFVYDLEGRRVSVGVSTEAP